MNVDNQLLLHVNAGHTPPDDLLKRILTQFKPNVVGASIQNLMEVKDKETRPDLAIIREDASNIGVDELKQMFSNAKDWPITAYFGSLRQTYKPEDIQPFVLTDGDNNVFMSLFIEGDVDGNVDPKDHTEHYNYVNGILRPKILEWCNDFADSEDIVAKIDAKLKSEVFKKEFLMHVGHRAHLSIMPIEGDVVNIAKNDLGGIEDWGWISQKIEAKEEPKAAEPAKANRFSFGWNKTKASSPSQVDPPKENPDGVHTVGDPKNNLPPLPDNVEKGEKDDGYPAKKQGKASPELAARVPSWLKTNDDVKLWYKIVSGEVHAQWKRKLPCTVKDHVAVKIDNLADFKAYALKHTVKPAETATASQTPKDAKVVETVATGVLTPKSMDNILDYVAKHLDKSSKEIIAPKEIQEQERVLPKFSEAVGLERDEMINWPIASLKKIGEDDVNALLCYAIEWRSAYRALKTGQLEAGTKVTETKDAKTTVTQTGDTVKTESVAKVDPPKPATKNRFSFGKAA